MILEQCKGVHCVDLSESFQTHIYLQNFVLIQPRTSPVKFAASRDKRAPLRVLRPVRLLLIDRCRPCAALGCAAAVGCSRRAERSCVRDPKEEGRIDQAHAASGGTGTDPGTLGAA